MENSFPRVLVISHTAFTKEDSMGSTLAAYFKHYPSDKIAQLFIKEMKPNIPVCFSYYKITDSELFKKIIKPFKTKVGSAIKLDEAEMENGLGASAKKQSIGGFKHRDIALLLRNILWSTKLWYTRQFKNWVRNFSPQVILVQPGDFAYIIKLATNLSKKLGIPLVVHQSESYYLKEYEKNTLIYRTYRYNYKKAYEKMMARASECIYLCEALERDYKKHFSDIGCTIMKATSAVNENQHSFCKETPKFIYAGNLGEPVGRCEPLLEIGRAVKKLGFKIDVYTASTGKHMKELTSENGIELHPAISYGELQQKIAESDFIVHIENQSEWHKKDLKYAFSTKIADMLASGCCSLIYGSTEIASIDYFKRYSLGCVIENEQELYERIKELVEDEGLRESYINNALRQASEYHNTEKNAVRTNEIIIKAFNGERAV